MFCRALLLRSPPSRAERRERMSLLRGLCVLRHLLNRAPAGARIFFLPFRLRARAITLTGPRRRKKHEGNYNIRCRSVTSSASLLVATGTCRRSCTLLRRPETRRCACGTLGVNCKKTSSALEYTGVLSNLAGLRYHAPVASRLRLRTCDRCCDASSYTNQER